ncbi:MAG: RNA methyltransferase [Bacteroidales bacterium]|jgi:TrmH family RNA methyltransferase|nr:RNA methyltransferase [Bacteroidales bacterium]
MLSATKIKELRSYQQKKFRDKTCFFIAETPKVIDTLLAAGVKAVEIYALPSWIADCRTRLCLPSTAVVEISEKELGRISGLVTPNEVFAVFEVPQRNGGFAGEAANSDTAKGISLVLDDIRDPGNMGTIIRLADWFGIDRIITSENSADVFQPKCVQASMGSVGNVPVYCGDLSALSAKLPKNFPVYGTFMNGASIYKTPLERSNAWFVVGNEAHGISADLAKRVTHKISIPSFVAADRRSTVAESLNAAMATAVICSEVRR